MKTILGQGKWTSIIGYILAGLTIYQGYAQAGETDWKTIIVGVLIGVLGRVAADSTKPQP